MGSTQSTWERKFTLGGGVSLLLTNKIMVDGVETEMPAGYPMVGMKGANQMFTFRIPKFTTGAVYDPVLDSSKSESIPTNQQPTTTSPLFVDGGAFASGSGAILYILLGLGTLLHA